MDIGNWFNRVAVAGASEPSPGVTKALGGWGRCRSPLRGTLACAGSISAGVRPRTHADQHAYPGGSWLDPDPELCCNRSARAGLRCRDEAHTASPERPNLGSSEGRRDQGVDGQRLDRNLPN